MLSNKVQELLDLYKPKSYSLNEGKVYNHTQWSKPFLIDPDTFAIVHDLCIVGVMDTVLDFSKQVLILLSTGGEMVDYNEKYLEAREFAGGVMLTSNYVSVHQSAIQVELPQPGFSMFSNIIRGAFKITLLKMKY